MVLSPFAASAVSPIVYIGGLQCLNITNVTNTRISCLLPEGTGVGLMVTVLVGSQVSRPVIQNGVLASPTVSFGAPQVTALHGCNSTSNAMDIVECRRGGGDILTIHVEPANQLTGGLRSRAGFQLWRTWRQCVGERAVPERDAHCAARHAEMCAACGLGNQSSRSSATTERPVESGIRRHCVLSAMQRW